MAVTAHGPDRWIHVRARIRGHLGEAGRLMQVGVLLDVTDWVENELMLERSRARLDLLMSNLPNGPIVVPRCGGAGLGWAFR